MDQQKKSYLQKHRLVIVPVLCFLLSAPFTSWAQCSICTRTAQQLGERPAKALNKGIIYLAFTPLAIFGVIGYRWWKHNYEEEANPND
jgi:hypothetical protein